MITPVDGRHCLERLDVWVDYAREMEGCQHPVVCVGISLTNGKILARFTLLYYHLAKTKPRFSWYSLEMDTSNSAISHAEERRELAYVLRSLSESLADAGNGT